MTFEEALAGETFYTLSYIHGGIAYKYSGLSHDQKTLFLNWFNEFAFRNPHIVPGHFQGGIADSGEAELAYMGYGHLSPVKFPRIFALCTNEVSVGGLEQTVESWVVNDLELSVNMVMDKTFENRIYLYSVKEVEELKRYIYCSGISKIPSLVDFPGRYKMLSLDVHAALMGLETKVDQDKHPIAMIEDKEKLDRIKVIAERRAQTLGHLICLSV